MHTRAAPPDPRNRDGRGPSPSKTDSDAHATEPPDHFPCARLIKDIGRGPNGARALPYDDAFALDRAMLDGHVSDVELGAVLI
ncbi:DNA-binding protein YbiB, partial [Burkholderia pseudomallei]